MKRHENRAPALTELDAIEASARRLEQAELEPAQAYTFAVVVRRMRERKFDQALARDQLRRAGFAAHVADAVMSEIGIWRRSVDLPA